MDTCSRLDEPGGVEWKDVNVGRLLTTTNGKRSIWWLRAAARSVRWPRAWPARFCFAPLGGTWGWARADGGDAAPHNAGGAAVGGPCGGDRLFAAGERAAAHGARYF